LSLEEVYRLHVAFVWRAVRSFGIAEEAVEDVVHDVFLVVQRRLTDYDGRASMKTWLYGIARGVARNHRRGQTRHERRLRLVDPPAAVVDPERWALYQESADLVRDFLAAIDRKKREVFELSDLEGMRGPEVAEALGINLNTVYSRLREARRLFAGFAASRRRGEGERRG
jgi:RNA polymerase sigma-70 factor (ECF subfamily)